MTGIDDLKTRAGLLLHRQLPEEYRFLDRRNDGEPGDLEAYLHGFGHLLDLVRGTIEQAYADAFADAIDFPDRDVARNREIQSWLIPYLAELVGAELLAPDPERRAAELSGTVGWYKTKGTLRNADAIADTVSGTETVTVEGWRRVLLTPRMKLPPFTAPAGARGDGDPLGASALPLGTPDLRKANRAVVDPAGANPLYRLAYARRDAAGLPASPDIVFWKPRAHGGAPCFPGAYDDTSLRLPDLRNAADPAVGPHPGRTLLHVRPPFGFFEPGLKEVTLPAGPNPLGFDLSGTATLQHFGPGEVLRALGDPAAANPPDKIVVRGDLAIPAAARVSFEAILFRGRLDVIANPAHPVRLKLSRAAVRQLRIAGATSKPSVEADDCLIDEIFGPAAFARLVHCTIMGKTHLERLWASDSIFNGDLVDVKCGGPNTCVRYSRIPDLAALAGCDLKQNPNIVTDDPNFIRLWFDDPAPAGCTLRPARFGEPGAAVLDLTTSPRVAAGAENGGEMGAFNHLFHAAGMAAVARKLADFLPLGQEVSIRYDPHLVRRPVAVVP